MTVVDSVPEQGSEAYTWWVRGAVAEHDLQVGGLNEASRALLDFMRDYAKHTPPADEVELLEAATHIYTSDVPLRRRLRFARRALFGARAILGDAR